MRKRKSKGKGQKAKVPLHPRTGEEFLVLLPGCDLDAGVRHAERLRILLSEEAFDTSEGTHVTTCSLGVASTSSSSPKSTDPLIRAADAALYRAKRNGRNRVET